MCRFEIPPPEQGNPSVAQVSFLMDGAPHERLVPGLTLWLWEGNVIAGTVEIVD